MKASRASERTKEQIKPQLNLSRIFFIYQGCYFPKSLWLEQSILTHYFHLLCEFRLFAVSKKQNKSIHNSIHMLTVPPPPPQSHFVLCGISSLTGSKSCLELSTISTIHVDVCCFILRHTLLVSLSVSDKMRDNKCMGAPVRAVFCLCVPTL